MSSSNDKTVSRIESISNTNNEITYSFNQDSNSSQNPLIQNMRDISMEEHFMKKLEEDVNENNFICKKCLSVPLIENITDLYMTVSCDHLVLPHILPSDFYRHFPTVDSEQMFDKLMAIKDLKCEKHNEEYAYYDTDCEINLCEKCISSINDHKSDTKINFDCYDIISKKQYIEENLKNVMIKKYENTTSFTNTNKGTDDNTNSYENNYRFELIYLNKIIKTILNAYEKYPCHKHYENIENIFEFLKKEGNKKELIKIKHKNELIYNINNNNIEKIISIKINEQSFNLEKTLNKCDEFDPEKIFTFNNLIILDLTRNKLKDIKPLKKFKMPKLEKLNLSVNFLGDELIPDIEGLDCPELRYLNLYKVHLEDYRIFDKMKHFPKLKSLYIGLNKFSKGIDRDNNTIDETKFDLSSLEEIDLSKIWSDKDGVKDLQYFKFKYLKEIYLSGNNINSINDIELDCNPLLIKTFWVANNNLEKFFGLGKYIYLEDLALNNNQIKDIQNLQGGFLYKLNNLKKFNIKDNLIDYNLQEKNDIIREVKNAHKDLDFKY